jgi:hypothetical protein
MDAVIRDPRNNITDNLENTLGIFLTGYQLDYMPYHQGGTVSASGSVFAFEQIEAESDYVWIPPQDAGRQKSLKFVNFVETLNQVVENVTKGQTTFELMDAWSSGTYYSSTLAAHRVEFTALFESILLSSKQFTLDLVPLLREVIVSGLLEAFVNTVENIDWKILPTPEPFKEAIDLALGNGYHTMAVDLTTKGLALFPEDAELQKIANILTPPKEIQTDIPPEKGIGQSMKWLKENRQHYQGEWVAVQNGVLLGHAPSRAKLSKMLDEADSSKTIITKIPDSIDLVV